MPLSRAGQGQYLNARFAEQLQPRHDRPTNPRAGDGFGEEVLAEGQPLFFPFPFDAFIDGSDNPDNTGGTGGGGGGGSSSSSSSDSSGSGSDSSSDSSSGSDSGSSSASDSSSDSGASGSTSDSASDSSSGGGGGSDSDSGSGSSSSSGGHGSLSQSSGEGNCGTCLPFPYDWGTFPVWNDSCTAQQRYCEPSNGTAFICPANPTLSHQCGSTCPDCPECDCLNCGDACQTCCLQCLAYGGKCCYDNGSSVIFFYKCCTCAV